MTAGQARFASTWIIAARLRVSGEKLASDASKLAEPGCSNACQRLITDRLRSTAEFLNDPHGTVVPMNRGQPFYLKKNPVSRYLPISRYVIQRSRRSAAVLPIVKNETTTRRLEEQRTRGIETRRVAAGCEFEK